MSPRPTPVVTRKKPGHHGPEHHGPEHHHSADPGIVRTAETAHRDRVHHTLEVPVSAGTRTGRTGAANPRPSRVRRRVGTPLPPAHQAPPRRVVDGSHRFRRRLVTWKRVLAVLVVLAIIAGAVWAVGFSRLLTVRTVNVLGVSRQSPAAVRTLLASDMGVPLARVDLSGAAQRVAALPAVRDVQVVRAWPNALDVRIIERTPVAVVSLGSGYTLVDVDGVKMATVPKAPSNLPVMTQSTLNAGGNATRAVVQSLNQLTPGLLAKVRSADARTQDSVTFTLKTGATVKWGSSENSEQKSEVLNVLLGHVKASTYDVTAPNTPVTR